MRLLHIRTEELYEFFEDEVPPYAILSHTWEIDEVTYDDLKCRAKADERKAGWIKVVGSCCQALRDGLEYIWIDTCCIDRSSSAELQEAINSMFRWYEMSRVCYVYLWDVPPGQDPYAKNSSFRHSRWFERGWTLQELIAPGLLRFFDQSWEEIGTKYTLEKVISAITGIGEEILQGSRLGVRRALRSTSVAQKMSWAARRLTTRPEDIAYSLLGIFEVNMPMLYGEGTRAFTRLQEEIMKVSDDQTLLAWGFMHRTSKLWGVSSALAESPADFSACSMLESYGAAGPNDSFSMTQRGLQLTLPVIEVHGQDHLLYCLLNCTVRGHEGRASRVTVMALHKVDSTDDSNTERDDEFTRLDLGTPLFLPYSCIKTAKRKSIYLSRLRVRKVTRWRLEFKFKNIELPPGYFFAGIYPPAIDAQHLFQPPTKEFLGQSQVLIHLAGEGLPGYILVVRYTSHSTLAGLSRVRGTTPEVLHNDFHNPGSRNSAIIQVVRSTASELLGVPFKDLNGNSNLFKLGMDSLTSLELIQLLKERTGIPLSPDMFLGCASLRSIERTLMLLSCSAPAAHAELADGSVPEVPGIHPEDLSFGLLQVQPDASLLDFAGEPKMWDNVDFKPLERCDKGKMIELGVCFPIVSDEMLTVTISHENSLRGLSLRMGPKASRFKSAVCPISRPKVL
ncbi:HET-domain-containing protein [Xylariaceae sp. AK1471]|nr:HET-domain-containing protein [Xylariaceae sp. AK1471]